MDWERKAAALNALAPIEIKIRKPGDWYVMQHVEVKDGSILKSVCGNGADPELAILDHWNQAVDNIRHDEYLVVRAYQDSRKAFRWNGFMWKEVCEFKLADVAPA